MPWWGWVSLIAVALAVLFVWGIIRAIRCDVSKDEDNVLDCSIDDIEEILGLEEISQTKNK